MSPATRGRTACFAALEHRFAVRSDDPAIVELVDWAYADLTTNREPEHWYGIDRSGEERFRVTRERESVIETKGHKKALAWLQWTINQEAVQSVKGSVVLHAACAEVDGRGILVVGATGAGKSTLVAALAKGGMAYVTDEACAIRFGDRTVRPYARPLSLTRRSLDLLQLTGATLPISPSADDEQDAQHDKLLVPASAVSGVRIGGPCQPVLVVFPERVASHRRRPGIHPVSRGDALRRLCGATFDFWASGRAAIETLAGLLERATACMAVGDDPADLASRLSCHIRDTNHSDTNHGT